MDRSIQSAIFMTLVMLPIAGKAERFHRDLMPGRESADSQRAKLEAELRNEFLLRSHSSELPKYERLTPTLLSSIRAYANASLTSRLSASTNTYLGISYASETETSEGPSASAESKLLGYGTRSGLTLSTANNIDFGGFIELKGQSAESTDRVNSGLASTQTVADHTIWRPGVTIKKTTGSWHAGGYYDLGASEKVQAKTTVGDDTLEAETYASISPRFGGFFQTDIGGSMALGTELTFLMGSESELKVEGQDVYDDSYRASFNLLFLRGGMESIWVSFSHETLSYADQDFVSFDNVPVTELEVTYTFPSAIFAGLLFSYSDDKQSTDEINQDYRTLGVGLRLGWKEPK